jgi:hypothetical protein
LTQVEIQLRDIQSLRRNLRSMIRTWDSKLLHTRRASQQDSWNRYRQNDRLTTRAGQSPEGAE